jgi:glyoxylase-like metal-dependent hydrolase (beta-lactamase superfamily II)
MDGVEEKSSRTLVEEMYIMDGGSIELDKSDLTFRRNIGKRVRIPTPIYLIKTQEGYVLYDTGWSPQVLSFLEAQGYEPRIAHENFLPGCLEALGMKPEDINTVIISHLHLDHAGGIQFFPNADIVVQKDEYIYAQHPHSFSQLTYNKSDFDYPSFNWKFVDGDQFVMHGLSVILANGHTPGLQALLVDLPKTGLIILCSDCCYIMQNIEEEVIPGIVWDPTRALHSIKKLKMLAELLDGQLLPNHDSDLWNSTLKKSPQSYR